MAMTLANIVTHTPTPVWIVLGVLVALGIAQLRTRSISARRVVLVPVVLGAISLFSAWHSFTGAGQRLAIAGWAGGALLGMTGNRVLDMPRRVGATADGRFRVEGSVAPLLLYTGIFLLRYSIGATLAVQPWLAGSPVAAVVFALALGLPNGLLIARSRKIWATRDAMDALQPA